MQSQRLNVRPGLLLFVLLLIICMPLSLYAADTYFIGELEKELASGRMDNWNGKDIKSMGDIKRYCSTFDRWQSNITTAGKYKNLSLNDKSILREYKEKVAAIQAKAMPKLKAAYLTYVVQYLGYKKKELKAEYRNSERTILRFTMTSSWPDKSLPSTITKRLYSTWKGLGLKEIEFYHGAMEMDVYLMRYKEFKSKAQGPDRLQKWK